MRLVPVVSAVQVTVRSRLPKVVDHLPPLQEWATISTRMRSGLCGFAQRLANWPDFNRPFKLFSRDRFDRGCRDTQATHHDHDVISGDHSHFRAVP